MTKKNGLHVGKVRRNGDKTWVKVVTTADGARVAFEDLFDIIRAIIECEVEKYENNGRTPEEAWDRWGRQVREFLAATTVYDMDWDTVAWDFGLPKRDGTRHEVTVVINGKERTSERR